MEYLVPGLPESDPVQAWVTASVGCVTRASRLNPVGINGRVYQLRLPDSLVVLKIFDQKRLEADPLRPQREVSAYHLAAVKNARCVPELIAFDASEGALILSNIAGDRPIPEKDGHNWTLAAQALLSALQFDPRDDQAVKTMRSADSPMTTADHLALVDKRFKLGQSLRTHSARNFYHTKLLPAWSQVSAFASRKLFLGKYPHINPTIYSLGDLGYHNSLRDIHNNFFFFDFEYAGLDDPVKALCDLEFQPSNTFSGDQITCWRDWYCEVSKESQFMSRYLVLRPVHALKWAMITLALQDRQALIPPRECDSTGLNKDFGAPVLDLSKVELLVETALSNGKER